MNPYMKNFGVWLGAPLIICHLLPYLGLYFALILLFPVLIAGTIMGIVKTSKEINGRIKFGEAVGPVLLMVGGPFIISWIISVIFYGMPSSYWILELIIFPLFVQLALGVGILLWTGVWYTYQKAGKEGWECIVPIYNIIVLLEIVKKPVWWIAMFIIPIANIVFLIMTMNALAKAFGKSEGFTVGLIFLGQIFWAILGYSDAEYIYGTKSVGNSEDLLDN